VIRDGECAVAGEIVDHAMGEAVLTRLAAELPARPSSGARAWGVALTCRHTGVGKTSLCVTLQPDGTLDIVSGVTDQGGGGHTVAQRVLAAVLSIDDRRVRFRRASTAEALQDPGTGGSRVTHIVGRSAQHAGEQLRARLEAATGMMLDADAFVAADGRRETFERGVLRATGGESWTVVGEHDGTQHGPGHNGDYTFSACGLDVEVDRETGQCTIFDAVFVCDVGAIINPIAHQGQIDGGFVFGLGSAAFEELVLDESAKVTNPSLADYKLPTIRDIPPLRTVLIPAEGHDGPYGAKMAGELSNTVVGAALGNAIANASGARLYVMPMTPERIFDAIHPR
jgi:CO/xanthine dehydrogenase Mo-binding subunit